MHCSAFLVGGLKRAPQIFFLNFFVWVVLFGHNYGPVNQKNLTRIFPAKLEKVPPFVLLILQFNIFRWTLVLVKRSHPLPARWDRNEVQIYEKWKVDNDEDDHQVCSTKATEKTSDTSDECSSFRKYGGRYLSLSLIPNLCLILVLPSNIFDYLILCNLPRAEFIKI